MNHFFKLGTMLTIVAGAAMTISSCSSNEIEPMSASDLALAKYEKAFIERFGQLTQTITSGMTQTILTMKNRLPSQNLRENM